MGVKSLWLRKVDRKASRAYFSHSFRFRGRGFVVTNTV